MTSTWIEHQLVPPARLNESSAELGRLGEDIRCWVARRRETDKRNQHRSQLDAIEALFSTAIEGVRRDFPTIDGTRALADVYEDSRTIDYRTIWLRRIWRYFGDRFDQRDDEDLIDALIAADDVVWSCYRQVFDRARLYTHDAQPGPPPLPFIGPHYSPEALPRELVPYDLKGEGFLAEFLERLPLPVVRLQPACVAAPWWLVCLAHEVGHHVQHGLLPGLGLVSGFAQLVQDEIEGAGTDARARWSRWSQEIFADAFSLHLVGEAALRATVELEFQRRAGMLESRSTYPAPAIRLLLLASMATRLGLAGEAVVDDLELDDLVSSDPATAADAAVVDAVATAVCGPLPGLDATMAQLTGFTAADFAAEGFVARCCAALAANAPVNADRSLTGPRQVVAAAFWAWTALPENGAGRAELKTATLTLIREVSEEGTRDSGIVPPDCEGLGDDLAALLSEATPETLASVAR